MSIQYHGQWTSYRGAHPSGCSRCRRERRDGWRQVIGRLPDGRHVLGRFLCWFCAPEKPGG
jgi:hypothetical protein